MIDLTPVCTALIALASALITSFLIPWLREKTDQSQREQLCAWAAIAVQAAEQMFVGVGRGQEKKLYALQWLEERGLTFDPEALDAAIEAAVYRLT